MNRSAIPFALLALTIGCTGTKIEDEPEEDRTDEIFVMSRLLDVHVEIDPDDWDRLRVQERGDLRIEPPECSLGESPYDWFSSRVTVDGETFEDVGIRKKGFFGSMDDTKPSLKIRFDKYVDDQEFLTADRLTLNNSVQDESYVRQCLSYEMFRAAGIPASRCNFAQVTVNGDYLGIYVNVEGIKKPFLRRHFDDDEGTLFEGTLSDFRDGWTGTFEQKTNEEESDYRAIDALSEALQEDDDALIGAIESVLDMDQFLTFWAMENMTAHWDGYAGNTNNFYFYDDPTSERMHFIPWGTDGTFGFPYMLFEERMAPHSINAAGLLARRLYQHPEGQGMYLDRMQSLLDEHWDEDAMEDSIIAMTGVFGPHLSEGEEGTTRDEIQATIDFVDQQARLIEDEIDEGPAEWEASLRGDLCGGDWDDDDEFGVFFNNDLNLEDLEGVSSYQRIEEDGSYCVVTSSLVDVYEVPDCGEDCFFGMVMTYQIDEIEDGSTCTEEDLFMDELTIGFGQGKTIIFEDSDLTFYRLQYHDGDTWTETDGGYSVTPDDGTDMWYFGWEY